MIRRFLAACLATGVGAALPAAPAQAQSGEQTMIVLDASGSMWGQIDGKTKIEIARDALGEVLAGIDPDLSLGMITYGHRRKGDCADIEVMVEAGPGTGGDIARIANGLKPRGKTPLTDAVRLAAERLRFTEERATVVLITDGIETCDADPCALGRELESLGVDFTAHVVGFGLTDEEGRQVACLAENTGGLYIQAGNAATLGEALAQTVAAPTPTPAPLPTVTPTPEPTPVPTATPTPEPTPIPTPEASLTAPPSLPIGSALTVGWEGPGEQYDDIQIFDPATEKVFRTGRIRDGASGSGELTIPGPGTPGTYRLRYWHAASRSAIARLDIEIVPMDVTIDAPDSAEAASVITAGWTGPGAVYDDIQVYDPETDKVIRSVRLRHGDFDAKTVAITLPAKAGRYELRYWYGHDNLVLATRDIDVTEAFVALDAPSTVTAASTFDVSWVGPGAVYDEIQIWDPRARGGEGQQVEARRVRHGDFEGRKVSLVAPAAPGTYELRYYNGENRVVLETAAIEVVDVLVSLDAPASVSAAATFAVGWEGPGATYDEVQLWDPRAGAGAGKQLYARRVRHGDFENRKVDIIAPAAPGTYELRYYNGDNRVVMATTTIEVVEIAVSLTPPASVAATATFDVAWDGPGGQYDEVQLWDTAARAGEGERIDARRVRHGDMEARTVTLTAPAAAGTYELRYWNGDNRVVMATATVEVTAVSAALKPPATVEATTSFDVTWDGPGGRNDFIELWDPAARGGEGQKLSDRRITNGDYAQRRVTMTAPAVPGTYELRYWNRDNRAVLATATVEVTSVSATVTVAPQVDGATSFDVTWSGPGGRNDFIELWDPAARAGEGQKIADRRLTNGDYDQRRVTFIAPVAPGSYELRYWNRDNRAVLATATFEVIAPEVSLSAPDTIDAGWLLKVRWEGPGARNDFIEVWDPATGTKLLDRRVTNGDMNLREVRLPAPSAPGTYELRYYNRDNRAHLASRTIEVLPVETGVSVDGPAKAGERFTVNWTGPGARDHVIELWDMTARGGEGQRLAATQVIAGDEQAKTVTMKAPDTPGSYELRYFDRAYKTVMATGTVEVVE